SITFEVLNTQCGGGGNWEFYVNGTLVATAPTDPPNTCTCGPPLQTVETGDDIAHQLKGVIRATDTGSIWYKWVFGDGDESGVTELSGALQYNVEASHAYSAAVGTPFTARLCVDEVDNSMANAVCDNYLVQIAPDNLDARVNIAIDRGLWYLYNHQLVSGSLNSLNGEPVTAWRSYSSYDPCSTASVVQSFEINNHKETGDPNEDPYVDAVKNGLNWLINGRWGGTPVLNSIGIGPQTYGDPDSDGNGIGIEVFHTGLPAYQGGMIMDCIIASQTPGADSGRDFDGDGATDTYKDIIQDMVDAYAWGQSDNGDPVGGGWRYSWNQGPDNSACQWAAIGLIPAEQDFGCIVPQWVKDRNEVWLNYSYRGGSYRYWGYTYCCNLVRGTPSVTRPAGMVQMVLSTPNYQSDQRWIDVESWYAGNYDSAISVVSPNNRTYYGWLSFVKAMRLSNIQNLSSARDWYRGIDPGSIDGLAERLIDEQQDDGSWVQDGQVTHPGYYGENMVAGWAIQMLRPALFASPPIPCFTANPTPGFPDVPITFDPACSDHAATDKDIGNLLLFEWDWDNDGAYDDSTGGPDEVTHAFSCAVLPCTYPVTLRVTDDNDPFLTATFTLNVEIKNPPHPPTADADGPYVVSLCSNDSLTLDGSGSFDINTSMDPPHQTGCTDCPDDEITAWEWDLTPPLTGFDDLSGETVTLDSTAIASYFGAGSHDVGLQVKDNTALSYPGAAEPDLTDSDFTMVEVLAGCDCNLTLEACEPVTISSSLNGFDVLRSTEGPNTGFELIGAAGGTTFEDNTVEIGQTYYYRLQGLNGCLSNAVEADVAGVCNQPPVCDIGGPYTAACGGTTTDVSLDGSLSTDPDLPDDTLYFSWATDCPGGSFDDSTSVTPTLTLNTVAPCPLVCNVTLSVTDEAEDSDACVVSIEIADGTPPDLLSGAVDQTVACHLAGNSAHWNGWVSANGGAIAVDDCGDVTWSSATTSATSDCGATGSVEVTFTATDECDNTTESVAWFTMLDTQAPYFTTPPSNLTVECDGAGNIAELEAWLGGPAASDACGPVTLDQSGGVLSDDCGATGSAAATWTATDECDNNAQMSATFVIEDTAPPVLTLDTTPIFVVDTDCSGDEVVDLPTASATDLCETVTITDDAPATFPPIGSVDGNLATTVTYTATDECHETSDAVEVMVYFGADIFVTATKHTVGSGSHPGSTKEPFVGIDICAYDKAEGACSRDVCGGISHQHYECIAVGIDTDGDNVIDTGPCDPTNCCTTDADGACTINLPPGDYIVISADATKTVLPDPLGVSASDLLCGELKQKHLQQIVKNNGAKVPGKTTRLTGSELLIIEPEFIVWDQATQDYPFVFDSTGEWGVTTGVSPPEGFESNHESLAEYVDNELEAVQFTITEVSSDLVPTETTFEVDHDSRILTIDSYVDIFLTSAYARSRGYDIEQLRMQGLIKDPPRQSFGSPSTTNNVPGKGLDPPNTNNNDPGEGNGPSEGDGMGQGNEGTEPGWGPG
ncbi:MAG: prenyltransferase/squalene oxidase repeat-containing protein, partial [Planctomycetota bacterium]